jgi:hypothetical protein
MKMNMEQCLHFDITVNADGHPQVGFFIGDIRIACVQLIEPGVFWVETMLCTGFGGLMCLVQKLESNFLRAIFALMRRILPAK